MTRITIEVSERDFGIGNTNPAYEKLEKAYREAKAKEIKKGDWVYSKLSLRIEQSISDKHEYVSEAYIKLPRDAQESLSRFSAGLKW